MEGELTTDGQVNTFGETWEVKIKFVAPLGEIPKEFQPAESKQPAKDEKQSSTVSSDKPTTDESGDEAGGQPAVEELNVKDLALTTDATDVEYKELVEQIVFKSKSNVKSVCAELAANLETQGWTTEGMDMVQPQSSILKRKRGEAELTIFVKPENGGSEVKMLTDGLSWDEE